MTGLVFGCLVLGMAMQWTREHDTGHIISLVLCLVILTSVIITQAVTGHPHMASSVCLGYGMVWGIRLIIKATTDTINSLRKERPKTVEEINKESGFTIVKIGKN